MKSVTLGELPEGIRELVRSALADGEVTVTEHGKPIARIVPEPVPPVKVPFSAKRRMTPEFAAYLASGEISAGTDITQMISEDRDRNVF